MSTEPEILSPEELAEKLGSLSEEEKKKIYEKSSPEVLKAFTEFIKSFGKSNEKLLDLHKDEINIYKELLSREDLTPEERKQFFDSLNEATKSQREERKDEARIKGQIVRTVSGIAIMAAGSFPYAKVDKKLGGSVALIGAGVVAGDKTKALISAILEPDKDFVPDATT